MKEKDLILIVEDNSVNRQILTELFENEFDVLEAENGQEALSLIQSREETLAAIILDIYMPVMDGYAVLEVMARNEKWREIPIIITTADTTIETEQRLLNLGSYTIVHKPINADIIRRQLIYIVEKAKKRKAFLKDYMLQKTLIHKTVNSFSCAYHFNDQSVVMGEHYEEFVEKDFKKIFDTYPFQLQDYILPMNLEAANRFFDIKNKQNLYDEIEIRLRIDTAYYEWFKIAVMINCDSSQNRDSAVFFFTNIEYEVEAKNKLTFMAMNDVLTHIPNMRTFSDDVRAMLAQYPEENFVMITMDIHQFRLVNKLFGYSEGDNVLRYFATKIQEIIEAYPKGVYCRMASDIFYVCISENEDVDALLSQLQLRMESYPIKFELKLFFGLYRITDCEESIESMIEHSSYARLEVKKSLFQSNTLYYNEKLKEKEYFEEVVAAEKEQALAEGQFEVYYQPKCNLLTQKIVGAEALIRWNSPSRGYLAPANFVPLFEQNGFITELDYYVYENVCKTLREWIDKGYEPVPISVNVSRCDLYDAQLFSRILEIVNKYKIPHKLIEFEITESAFILESKLLSNFADELRKQDFCVLIDDFGSGYSSLNSLKDIEVDVLKIDISFLPASSREIKPSIILASVIDMAKKLGLDIIAEGVENKEQLDLLEKLGCENVQGFYYYHPMPISEFEMRLQEQETNSKGVI